MDRFVAFPDIADIVSTLPLARLRRALKRGKEPAWRSPKSRHSRALQTS